MFEFIAENFFTVGTIVGLVIGFIVGVLYETTNTRRLENDLDEIITNRLINCEGSLYDLDVHDKK